MRMGNVIAICSDRAASGLRSPWAIAALARQALVAEAELTPKPGLVDRRGSGAHNDLSLELMVRSANVLEPYFASMGQVAGLHLTFGIRQELAAIGRAAEHAMFNATQGSNSHKGAIWILGLLVAAVARTESQSAKEITEDAGSIARIPDRVQPKLITHGDIVRSRYGFAGARGEASNNFPHILRYGLPTLRQKREAGFPEEVCRIDALLSLMSELNDTCLLFRGGIEGLNAAQSGARAVLNAGGYGCPEGRAQLHNLDGELSARQISPGGSADLLGATIFLDAIERGEYKVHKDRSEWEERDGTP